jgi:endoglucanase
VDGIGRARDIRVRGNARGRPAATGTRGKRALGVAAALAALLMSSAATAGDSARWPSSRPVRAPGDRILLAAGSRLFVAPDPDAVSQAGQYLAAGRPADAAAIRAVAGEPQAVWFTGGSPADVAARVATITAAAAADHAVPVLVAYNIPHRDCGLYSGGGASSEDDYQRWIDGFADGLVASTAVVVLEPDALATLSQPGCTGAVTDERYRELRYAVHRLRAAAPIALYLDGGHSAWRPIEDTPLLHAGPPPLPAGSGPISAFGPAVEPGMATRLIRAGVAEATGFVLNVSNYRSTPELIAYGNRLARCVGARLRTGAEACGRADGRGWLPHFIIDTGRNGRGPWVAPAGWYPDPQEWCSPPDRGLGERPTTHTGQPLVDAFLWIKRPGESDGACTRGTAGPADPLRGAIAPPAGAWWPDNLLELVRGARPALAPANPGTQPAEHRN